MLSDSQLTPMYRQWAQAKRDYPDVLLLFRMGDFYEMFGEDAQTGARALELTLTARRVGDVKLPMCGVPYHAIDKYLRTLVEKGFRAAICEQVEDARQAKGLVRRAVTRVVTPGTLLEDEILDGSGHNFLVSVAREREAFGIAAVDISTGDFMVTQVEAPRTAPGPEAPPLPEMAGRHRDAAVAATVDEIVRLGAAEVLISTELAAEDDLRSMLEHATSAPVTVALDEPAFASSRDQICDQFGVASLAGFGCEDKPAATAAAAQALRYLRNTQLEAMPRLSSITTYSTSDFMVIDGSTRRNLELVASLRDGGKRGTLLGLLDRTLTPMGARALRQALLQPLLDIDRINARLDAVGELITNRVVAEQLAERLHEIYDIERLCARATAGRANAKDLRALCVSLQQLPAILTGMQGCDAGLLRSLRKAIDPLAELAERLDSAIVDTPPVLITEGGIIREGYSDELDSIRHGAAGGREWIASFQDVERGRTGIKSLKVGYNKVFGYYIEVSKANLDLVPDYYERKQTLVNGERFITPDLKEKEALVLGADERSQELEHDLFVQLRDAVAAEADRLMATARAIAELDMLASLAATAVEYGYTRPELDTSDRLVIRDGRHPVVEQALTDELFVPNDTDLDCHQSQLQIVTGPNMAGKSTYLRQVALLALLAQMGSWVPARSYSAGIIDRIFTRVGASDDLATGQSTFMVEMTETANILSNATDRSLIILDEIGRGTSTWDGMSIAWAVAEYIVEQIGAKTLFATHYHHLNELERLLEGVRNLRVTVKEQGDDIIFLRKIVEGGTDRSYGIQVARLAGLPVEVIQRARDVLSMLESEDIVATPTRAAASKVAPTIQLKLFEGVRDPVVEKLKAMELDTLSPLEALMRLKQLQDEAKSGD